MSEDTCGVLQRLTAAASAQLRQRSCVSSLQSRFLDNTACSKRRDPFPCRCCSPCCKSTFSVSNGMCFSASLCHPAVDASESGSCERCSYKPSQQQCIILKAEAHVSGKHHPINKSEVSTTAAAAFSQK